MAAAVTDLYAILGVSRTATSAEIRRAYRALARAHHPDTGGDAAQFRLVADAYAVLSDPAQRTLYDNGAALLDMSLLADMFGDVFTSGFGDDPRTWKKGAWKNPAALRGYDVQSHLTVTFQEAFTGADVPLQTHRDAPCPRCNPTGGDESGGRCDLCDATPAWITELRTVRVFIPAGVKSGERIRLAEEGGWGTPRGDVYVRVTVETDPRFQTEGTDLRVRALVDPVTARDGGTVDVTVADGTTVTLPVPVGVVTGSVLRLRGYGPVIRSGTDSGSRGDLYIDLLVPPLPPLRRTR